MKPFSKNRGKGPSPLSHPQGWIGLLQKLAACATLANLLASGALAGPQIATVAQVGEPASPGTRYVFIYLQYLNGAQPHPAYAIYHKPGLPDSPEPYQRLAVIRPTVHIPTIAALMQRAADAGFDNLALELVLDDILPSGPYANLAEKVAAFHLTEPSGLFAHQQVIVAKIHPQTALPLGQAYIARVPGDGPNTFEVRVFDPVTEAEGPVVGRVTSPATPVFVPPPGGLSEKIEATPRGHLRAHLRWCLPQPLREMAFHWSGFAVFRVPRANWQQTFGVEPPLNMTRATLLEAMAQNPNLAVQVNDFPIAPGEELPCPVPAGSEIFFMTDDNDSSLQMAFEPGGVSFEDGFEATYFVAAIDHFGRIGELSPGLPVTMCDRLPPLPPSSVRVDNIYKQEGASDHALHISWRRDDPEEVRRYHLFRYLNPDDVFIDRQSPSWPDTANRIAVVDNTGTGDRVRFTDTTPGALSLPADDGRTRWFSIVAEDDTSCPSPAGFGNLSGPSGPVPGALYNLAGPGAPAGRLRIPCCDIEVTQHPLGDVVRGDPLRLVAERLNKKIAWVEFRDVPSDMFLGRFHFGNSSEVTARPNFPGGAAIFQARFGTDYDFVSEWVGMLTSSGPPYPEHRWRAEWRCRPATACPDGVMDPVDPDTGDFLGVCVELVNPSPNVVEAALYRRLGDNGPLVLLRREKLDSDGDGVNDLTELCEPSPPANPGLACYYLQYFDRNGNPSVVVPLDCVRARGTEDFPVPRITHFFPPEIVIPDFPIAGVTLAWFCPRPGVDRFEVAVTPPPPGVTTTFQGGHEAGVGPIWGVVDSDRLAAGFGEGSPNFAINLILERGKNYQAKVRAVGEGLYGKRDAGAWSDEAKLAWLYDPDAVSDPIPDDCPFPWPARDIAPLITDPARELEAFLVEWADNISGTITPVTEVWVKVGQFEQGQVVSGSLPGFTVQIPPRIQVEDLQAILTVPLAFTVYLHQTSAGSRGTMLQASHYVDEILTATPEPGHIDIIDRAFAVASLEPPGAVQFPPALWFRVRHPLIAGRDYRCAVVVHGGDREPIETLRTVEINVPPLP